MSDILQKLNPAQREVVTATEGFILCVTFINKATSEMRQQIHALTGDNDSGYVNTFHGFCVSIL